MTPFARIEHSLLHFLIDPEKNIRGSVGTSDALILLVREESRDSTVDHGTSADAVELADRPPESQINVKRKS
jgi:hypothetical protein